MTPAEVVLDASALLRGLLAESTQAARLVDDIVGGAVRASAPDLIDAESTHALLRLTRAGHLTPGESRRLAARLGRLPVERYATAALAAAALEHALAHELSAYDGMYAALAEARAVPLATFDRRLAATVTDALLLA